MIQPVVACRTMSLCWVEEEMRLSQKTMAFIIICFLVRCTGAGSSTSSPLPGPSIQFPASRAFHYHKTLVTTKYVSLTKKFH